MARESQLVVVWSILLSLRMVDIASFAQEHLSQKVAVEGSSVNVGSSSFSGSGQTRQNLAQESGEQPQERVFGSTGQDEAVTVPEQENHQCPVLQSLTPSPGLTGNHIHLNGETGPCSTLYVKGSTKRPN